MSHEPLVYTVSDACRVAGIRSTKLYGLIGAGKIEARKLGSRTVIPADSLRRYVENLPAATIRTGQKAAA